MTEKEIIAKKNYICGYTTGLTPYKVDKTLDLVLKELSKLPDIKKVEKTEISIEEIKERAREIVENYFTFHKIAHLSHQTLLTKKEEIAKYSTGAELARNINSLITMIDPFDLPIELNEGSSLVGETIKPIMGVATEDYKANCHIPFEKIILGNNLTELSIATYIHELVHTQTESIIGYTTNFYYREVISILLEKIVALELDPTGELLRISERNRYKHLYNCCYSLKAAEQPFFQGKFKYDDLLVSSSYVHSTLLATKIFDNYQKLRKPKDKAKLIKAIQSIFDGEKTVEQFLTENQVTLAQARDLNLIRRHI